ncbi:MAG TPA: hypothetical protein VJC07_01070 [Candidatus Nanoarchaeia archaeon]|nr:hypothetical protein [Candidatus Nanoarchaeia archaeon]
MGIFSFFRKKKQEPVDVSQPVEIHTSQELTAFTKSSVWDIKMGLNARLLTLNRQLKRVVYANSKSNEPFSIVMEDAQGEDIPSLYLVWRGRIPKSLERLPAVGYNRRLAVLKIHGGGMKIIISFYPDTYTYVQGHAVGLGPSAPKSTSVIYSQPDETALKSKMTDYFGSWLDDYIKNYLIPQLEISYRPGF